MEMNDVTSSENRLWLKLDKTFFSFEKDLYICACYIRPVNSVYYDDDFSKLEDEISKVMSNSTCNILIAGYLNARISNHIDFIVNESNSHETLEYLLPDNYNTDYNIIIIIDVLLIKYLMHKVSN